MPWGAVVGAVVLVAAACCWAVAASGAVGFDSGAFVGVAWSPMRGWILDTSPASSPPQAGAMSARVRMTAMSALIVR